ncbi:hypothetical protein [Burkholderia ambifaria]|uniref:hypothetical protein n=1 Tax=Burkholderia ambifaria TaxID=152480 RepID=UPI001FC7F9B3|nr:hypothetical protein [Burkholderia ambifaria]
MRIVVHRSLSLRRVMPLAAAPVAIVAPSAGNRAMAAATLACARSAARPRSRVAASRMHGPRPSSRRPRGTDRFLLFALP